MSELEKLEAMLKQKNVHYARIDEAGFEYRGEKNVGEFHQIKVEGRLYTWDVICNPDSCGYEQGLLEYKDNIEPDVIGYLTAEKVMRLVETSEYRRGYQDAIRDLKRAITEPTDIRWYDGFETF